MIGLLAVIVILVVVLVPRDTFIVTPDLGYEERIRKRLSPMFKYPANYRRIKRRVSFPRRYEDSRSSSSEDVNTSRPSDRRADIKPVESPSIPGKDPRLEEPQDRVEKEVVSAPKLPSKDPILGQGASRNEGAKESSGLGRLVQEPYYYCY